MSKSFDSSESSSNGLSQLAVDTGRSRAEVKSLWNSALASLQKELDPQIFSAYLEPIRFSSFDAGRSQLIVSAPSKFVRDHFDQYYKDRMCLTISDRLALDEVTVKYLVSAKPHPAPVSPPKRPGSIIVKKQEVTSPVGSGFKNNYHLNSKYTFASFVVGNSNQFCHAAARQVAEGPGKSYNPLFIYGGVGLGKTHLLHAIGNLILDRDGSASVLYMSAEMFMNELIKSLRLGKMDEFKYRLRSVGTLLIDDIQFFSGKERTQEEFFHTFNALHHLKHQIVITSDKLPQDIKGLEDRLKTRFAWGLTADLQAPDFETRVAILNRRAALDSFILPQTVAHLIAENISSNVRELEGALTRLSAASSLQKAPITKEMALNVLKPLLEPKKIAITIDDIKKAVSTHFKLKISDLSSKRRTRNLSFPRHIAMYLCRKHTTASYPEIGANFGGRDHSSVIHAANVVSKKIAADQAVKDIVSEIERAITGVDR